VTVCAPANSDEQFEAMNEAKTILNENGPYSLVIVDSITAHFRTEYQGRGELADRQQALGQHMAALKAMAQEYNVAVVLTNQVHTCATPGHAHRNGRATPLLPHCFVCSNVHR